MAGVAHMAALRIVLEREKEKKKKQKLSAFEDYIATQVAADNEAIKMEAENTIEATSHRTAHCHYSDEELKSRPSPTSPWACLVYHYDSSGAWLHRNLTEKTWFDGFIMMNILAVGVAIGVELNQTSGDESGTIAFTNFVDELTFWVFLWEAILRIWACGSRPWVYFRDINDGSFNTFDFILVVVSVVFSPYLGLVNGDVSSIKVLRLARLLRLLDFVAFIPEIRVLSFGLVAAMESVWYIMMLLLLMMYIFAVLGVYLFGDNDPANFGGVAVAMMNLMHTATFSNWSSVALISFYGCDKFGGNGYRRGYEDIGAMVAANEPLPFGGQPMKGRESVLLKSDGGFGDGLPLWVCSTPSAQPTVVIMYYVCYSILVGMVVMSLFVGVITIGMFSEYSKFQDEKAMNEYHEGLDSISENGFDDPNNLLRKAVDQAMGGHPSEKDGNKKVEKIEFTRSLDNPANGRRNESDMFKVANSGANSASNSRRSSKSTPLVDTDGGAPGVTVTDVELPPGSADLDIEYGRPQVINVRASRESNASSEDMGKKRTSGVIRSSLTGPTAAEIKEEQWLEEVGQKLGFTEKPKRSKYAEEYHLLSKKCEKLHENLNFQNFVTVWIITAGVTVGLAADRVGDQAVLDLIDLFALLVFTIEAIIGIVAAGERPMKYFGDPWSQFDFLIVCNGWLDLMKIFQSDFLVVFRLLRLLRVFRLARAFPKLRSIVNSLLKALSSVGWIALLMFVFNYIASVVAMLLFQKHDPFYYGSMQQALFTTFIISTQDLWDVVMRVNTWGCADFTGAYPLTVDGSYACEHPRAFGFIGALYFLIVIVIASLILPTMLIGVVAINFEESSTQYENDMGDRKSSEVHIEIIKKDMGDFFTDERLWMWESIFKYLDVNGQGRLDLNEISPLIQYLSREHLGYTITHEEVGNVVLTFDDDDTGDLNFGELMTLIRYVVKARDNAVFSGGGAETQVSPYQEVLEEHHLASTNHSSSSSISATLPSSKDEQAQLEWRMKALGYSNLNELLDAVGAPAFPPQGLSEKGPQEHSQESSPEPSQESRPPKKKPSRGGLFSRKGTSLDDATRSSESEKNPSLSDSDFAAAIASGEEAKQARSRNVSGAEM